MSGTSTKRPMTGNSSSVKMTTPKSAHSNNPSQSQSTPHPNQQPPVATTSTTTSNATSNTTSKPPQTGGVSSAHLLPSKTMTTSAAGIPIASTNQNVTKIPEPVAAAGQGGSGVPTHFQSLPEDVESGDDGEFVGESEDEGEGEGEGDEENGDHEKGDDTKSTGQESQDNDEESFDYTNFFYSHLSFMKSLAKRDLSEWDGEEMLGFLEKFDDKLGPTEIRSFLNRTIQIITDLKEGLIKEKEEKMKRTTRHSKKLAADESGSSNVGSTTKTSVASHSATAKTVGSVEAPVPFHS